MSRISSLKEEFISLQEVIRLKEIEDYIDSNSVIYELFNDLKTIQKKMIQFQMQNEENSYKTYKNMYNETKDKLFDMPFVEEYFELSEIVEKKLMEACAEIEKELDIRVNS